MCACAQRFCNVDWRNLLCFGCFTQVGPHALRSAKRVIERFAVKYYNSGEVSNKVGIAPRLLGRITGNMWARDGEPSQEV